MRLWVTAPWIGAGVLFFCGALLGHLPLGVVAATCGALAAIAMAVEDEQQGCAVGAPSFFTGFDLTCLAVLVIVLTIPG